MSNELVEFGTEASATTELKDLGTFVTWFENLYKVNRAFAELVVEGTISPTDDTTEIPND